jgi:hypothetical protein
MDVPEETRTSTTVSERLIILRNTNRIVMQGINTIRQRLLEELPLHGKGIPIQPQNVSWIHFPDSRLQLVIKGRQTPVLWVTGLVNRIVSRHPWVVLVARSNLLPQPDRPVLVVLVVPEGRVIGPVVRVPVWILTAWDCVHVEDGINAIFCALTSQT